MTRVTPHTRFAAFVLAALWAVAPVLSVVHAGSHGHRYCAEHDAFEEGAATALASSSDAHADGATVAQAGAVLEDAHVSCPLAHPGSRQAVLAAGARTVLLASVDFTSQALSEERPFSSIELLALAPKVSPPQS